MTYLRESDSERSTRCQRSRSLFHWMTQWEDFQCEWAIGCRIRVESHPDRSRWSITCLPRWFIACPFDSGVQFDDRVKFIDQFKCSRVRSSSAQPSTIEVVYHLVSRTVDYAELVKSQSSRWTWLWTTIDLLQTTGQRSGHRWGWKLILVCLLSLSLWARTLDQRSFSLTRCFAMSPSISTTTLDHYLLPVVCSSINDLSNDRFSMFIDQNVCTFLLHLISLLRSRLQDESVDMSVLPQPSIAER